MNTLKRWKSNTSAKSVATVSSQATTSDGDYAAHDATILEEEAGTLVDGSGSSSNHLNGMGGIASTSASASASTSTSTSPPAAKDHKPFASSGGLRLTLTQPTTNKLVPGVTMQGCIDASSLRDCKELKLVLTGKAAYMIMGKMRYQAALGVNALGGAGYAGAAPLTMRESHTFLHTEMPIWLPGDDSSNATNYKALRPEGNDRETVRFEFSLDLPRVKKCTCEAATYVLPPSLDLRRFEASGAIVDRSTVEIRYSLSAVMERKGFLKRKHKAKIPLAVADDAPPGYSTQEETHAVGRGPFKYASSNESGAVPELECMLSFVPPTGRGGIITYTVKYRVADPSQAQWTTNGDEGDDLLPPPPTPEEEAANGDLPPLYHASSAPLLATVEPRCEVVLNRACFTRPIERTHEGTPFRWPSIVLAQGKNDAQLDAAREESNARLRIGEIRGVLSVPPNEVTMYTCGAEVAHHMQIRFFSTSLKRPIFIRARVYLPSGSQ